MSRRWWNTADSSKEIDESTLSCEEHGNIITSIWSSILEYALHAHEKESGKHNYEVTNERTGMRNPFEKR